MEDHRGIWRGKRTDNGEWIEGYYSEFEIAKKAIPCIIPFSPLTNVFPDNGVYQVNPSTLGECTGLRDRNGKLIFEGDIVTHDKLIFVVEWDSDRATFVIRYFNIVSVFTMLCGWELEVIGNIHDNPKLLKGADNENK